MNFPHKVSIFNKYISGDNEETDVFKQTLLSGVLYVKESGAINNKTGLLATDLVTIYIPKTVKTGKTFVDDFTYKTISEDTIDLFYTLSKDDKISLGDITLDDELTLSQFKEVTGNVYRIVSISDYDFGNHKSWILKCE